MNLTLLYIYGGFFLVVFLIFKLSDRKSNPLKKVGFWLTTFFSSILLTIILGYILLRAVGGPIPEDGLHQEFYENGRLRSKYVIKNGCVDGVYKSWFASGKLESISKFRNGKLIDTSISYFESGQVQFFEVYNNERLIRSIVYQENGKMQSETYNPIEKNLDNYQKKYHENGVLSFETKISNSTFSGTGNYYNDKGKKTYNGKYRDGQKDGIWVKYDTLTGQIVEQDTFDYKNPRPFKDNWK